MAKDKSAKADPMIAALLNKLPEPGQPWPIDQRIEWLNMLAMGFNMVFGVADTIHIGKTNITYNRTEPLPGAPAGAEASANTGLRPQVAKQHPPRLFIDKDGFARRDPGGVLRLVDQEYPRIMPGQVDDILFDDRGELGDLGSITWADNSTGVLGLQLEISATPVKVA